MVVVAVRVWWECGHSGRGGCGSSVVVVAVKVWWQCVRSGSGGMVVVWSSLYLVQVEIR